MQNIKTAPMNGTWIVVYVDGVYKEAHFYCGFWEDKRGKLGSLPTHWCPLPVVKKPPSKDELLAKLFALKHKDDKDVAYIDADLLLLEYINDDEITEYFYAIGKG